MSGLRRLCARLWPLLRRKHMKRTISASHVCLFCRRGRHRGRRRRARYRHQNRRLRLRICNLQVESSASLIFCSLRRVRNSVEANFSDAYRRKRMSNYLNEQQDLSSTCSTELRAKLAAAAELQASKRVCLTNSLSRAHCATQCDTHRRA